MPVIAVAWTWVTASTSNALLAATAAGAAFFGAVGAAIEYARDAQLDDYLLYGSQYSQLEGTMVVKSDDVTATVDSVVDSFDASTVDPSLYVPQVEEIATPEISIVSAGASLLDVLKDSNALKERELAVMQAHLNAIKDQNAKLVNQNEILYKLTVENMEANKFAAARLALDKAHTPAISRALVQQAANARDLRRNVSALEGQTLVTTVNVPETVVNVAAPTVNNTVDTAPIAAAVGTINDTLTPMAENASVQKQIADFKLTPQTVLNSLLEPMATGTPLEIYLQRAAAQAKNDTDETEFELDGDLLDELSGAFQIPGMEGFDPDALNAYLFSRVGGV